MYIYLITSLFLKDNLGLSPLINPLLRDLCSINVIHYGHIVSNGVLETMWNKSIRIPYLRLNHRREYTISAATIEKKYYDSYVLVSRQ